MDKDLKSIQNARELARKVSAAQVQFREYPQAQVDRIIKGMVEAGFAAATELARVAVEETGMGVESDKVLKNEFATRDVGAFIRTMKTAGIVEEDRLKKTVTIAYPMGVVTALSPTTNPTSTALYNCLISLKGRNGVVLSPHPRAVKSSLAAAEVMHRAAVKEGAPEGIIACMEWVSLEGTNALMTADEVDVILATGGSAMVRAAYGSGKPAYGVGPGNVPVFIESSANPAKAVEDVLTGKCFDNGLICSAESNLICESSISNEVEEELVSRGGWFLRDDQKEKLEGFMIRGKHLNPEVIGQDAVRIARMAGIEVPTETRALVVRLEGIGKEELLSREKLSPVLGYIPAPSVDAAIDLCRASLELGGRGHTLVVHSGNERLVKRVASRCLAYRIVVNSPSPHGSVGYTTDLDPALTLGSGTASGSITSDNISPLHLIHKQRIGYETKPMVNGVAKRRFSDESGVTKKGDYSRFDVPRRPDTEVQAVKYGTSGLSDKDVEKVIDEFTKGRD